MNSFPPTRLTLRFDADEVVGAGHAMRSMTLGEAWQKAAMGPVEVVGSVTLPFVTARLRELRWQLSEQSSVPDGVEIVDSYSIEKRRRTGTPESTLVVVDDVGGEIPVDADLIVNPNCYNAPDLYDGATGFLLGGHMHTPVRAGLPGHLPERRELGVLLGGGSVPSRLIDAIDQASATLGMQPVGVGGWVPGHWQRADSDKPWMALSHCESAIVGAGSSTWEAATVGIPLCVVVRFDNQRRVGAYARNARVPVVDVSNDEGRDLTEAVRGAVASASVLPAVRAGGAERIVRRIAEASTIKPARGLTLRRANARDANALFEIANDEGVRAASGGRPTIPWETHEAWFSERLATADALIFAAESNGRLVGTIRFETRDQWKSARLSYALHASARGRRLGARLVWQGLRALENESLAETSISLRADVLDHNAASLAIFRRLGWGEERADANNHLFTRCTFE